MNIILLSRPYLTRHTQYDVDELLASTQIKLITGPRRTGKSTEALLMQKGRNFAYLNFDDGKLLSAWDDDLVWDSAVKVDRDTAVMQEFIRVLLPLAPHVTTGINNIRKQINNLLCKSR